jgi:hypothetical protein
VRETWLLSSSRDRLQVDVFEQYITELIPVDMSVVSLRWKTDQSGIHYVFSLPMLISDIQPPFRLLGSADTNRRSRGSKDPAIVEVVVQVVFVVSEYLDPGTAFWTASTSTCQRDSL